DRVDVERIDNVAYMIDTTVPRPRSLVSVLEAEDPACAIIFCNTKVDTEMVTAYLRRRGYNAVLLNSDLPQKKREEVMGRMKAGEQRFLVATDIAARGIDISFLPCVIHYEFPHDVELYIHRTGRTGRVDRKGRAVTLVGRADLHGLQKLSYKYGLDVVRYEAPSHEEALKMLSHRRIRKIKEMLEAGKVVPEEFRTIAREILTDPDVESVVSFLVDEYLAKAPLEDSKERDRDRSRDRGPKPPSGDRGRPRRRR
ncbi:MAG: DEAD/DEAH box helicase, partial [Deltaproteobacteria bacterium]|nr:DEAD/DEAH box helicase [Deltaproteobacteria bacterium]